MIGVKRLRVVWYGVVAYRTVDGTYSNWYCTVLVRTGTVPGTRTSTSTRTIRRSRTYLRLFDVSSSHSGERKRSCPIQIAGYRTRTRTRTRTVEDHQSSQLKYFVRNI